MRLVAIAAVALLLTGCAATPSFTAEQSAATDALEASVAEVDGLSDYKVSRFPIGEGDVRLTVTLNIGDETHTESIVTAVTDLVDDGPFEGDVREMEIYVGDGLNQFSMSADGGDPLPTERVAIFARWLDDPRVSDLRWDEQLDISLEGQRDDAETVEKIYGEVADDVTLAGGGLSIFDPGSYTLETARLPFSDERFAAINEILALGTVSSCTFTLEPASGGTFMHHILCFSLVDLDVAGSAIESILDDRGLLESTDIRVLSVDGEEFTHEGSFVEREG